MRDGEALAEAIRRWPKHGFARHNDYAQPGEPYWCIVGWSGYAYHEWHGCTWEEAFASADSDPDSAMEK